MLLGHDFTGQQSPRVRSTAYEEIILDESIEERILSTDGNDAWDIIKDARKHMQCTSFWARGATE